MILKFVKKLSLLSMFILASILLLGCGGMEYAPKNGVLYWPSVYVEADRAVEAARQAGKDKQCPDAFNIARSMVDDAYELHPQCRKHEARELAMEGKQRANALCPAKLLIAASSPPPPSPPPAEAKIIDRLSLHVHFNFDTTVVKEDDHDELNRAVKFIKKYPDSNVVVEGHTDNIGPKDYNHTLSHMRADVVKKYLVENGGLKATKIKTVGYGESRPLKSNDTAWGRYWNRRVDVVIVSE